jgi:hypothetical protein
MSEEQKTVEIDGVHLSQDTIDEFKTLVDGEPAKEFRDEGLEPDGQVKQDELEEGKTDVPKEEAKPAEEVETTKGKVETPTPTVIESLPPKLVQAAYRSGLSQEDITALGDKAEPILSKLAGKIDQASAELGELGHRIKLQMAAQQPAVQPQSLPQLGLTPEELEMYPQLQKFIPVMDALANQQQQVQQKMTVLEGAIAENEKRNAADFSNSIEDMFDGAAKTFPQLGDSEKLTFEQKSLRASLFDRADSEMVGANAKGIPMSWDEAVENAVYAGLGHTAVQTARQQIIDEVKTRSSQILSRGTKRKTQPYYEDEDKKLLEKVSNRAKALGVEFREAAE